MCSECIALTPVSEVRQWHKVCPVCKNPVSGAVVHFTMDEARKRAAAEKAYRRDTILRKAIAMWVHRSAKVCLEHWAKQAAEESWKRVERKKFTGLLHHALFSALLGWQAKAAELKTVREEAEETKRVAAQEKTKREGAEAVIQAAAAAAEQARVAAVEAARVMALLHRALGKLMQRNVAAAMSAWRVWATHLRLLKAVCRRMLGQWRSRELSWAFGGWVLVADDAKEAQQDADDAETLRRLEQKRQIQTEADLRLQLQVLSEELLSLSLSLSVCLSSSLSLTHTHSLFLSLSLSLTHTHTHRC